MERRNSPVGDDANRGPPDPVETRASAIANRLFTLPHKPRKSGAKAGKVASKPAKEKGG